MKKEGASGQRRRRRWVVLLVCLLGVPVVLYAMLPLLAGMGLRYFLTWQGYHHVVVQLGYPGWRVLRVPMLQFHQDLDGETLAVTVQDSQIEYTPGTLLSGRVQRLHVPHAAVTFHAQHRNKDQPCTRSRTSQAGPGFLAGMTVGHLLQPVPALPVRILILDQVHVWRECASGPLRDVRLSGQIQQDGTGVEGFVVLQGQDGSSYRLQVAMPQAGSLEATLSAEPAPSGPIVLVQSQLHQQPAGLQVVGKLTADFARLAPFLAVLLPLGEDVQQVVGNLHAEWTATAPLNAALETAWQPSATALSGGTYRLMGVLEHLPPALLDVAKVEWDVHGTLALDKQQARATVEAASFVSLAGVHAADLTVPAATVQLTERLALSLQRKSQQWSVAPVQVSIRIPQARWQDTAVTLKQAHLAFHKLQGKAGHWQTEGMLRLTDVAPHLPTMALPVTQWDVNFAADAAVFRVQAQGAAWQNTVTWRSQMEYQWTTRAGTAELHLGPVQFAAPGVPWKTVLTPGPHPFDLTDGRLSAMGSLRWNASAHEALAVQGSATITLDQLSGFYNTVLVQGLSTTLTLEAVGPDMFRMPEPATVTVAAIQAGVDITDVALRLQLGWQPPAALPWVDVRDVRAALLGGKIMSDGLRFEPAEPHQAVAINIEHIDIQQILQLEQQQGLVGTGVLDGMMPVVLMPTGIQVRDGFLEARPPGGILQYRPAPGMAPTLDVAPTQVQMVLQALENFHYTVLKIQVQYAADGTLILAVRLEGQNPDWQAGRPAHFNLTVQENMPALLQTLQLIQGIPQTIENRLQKQVTP